MKAVMCQNTQAKWADRERLRDKGQFWTPNWVAEAMVAYVSHARHCNGRQRIFFLTHEKAKDIGIPENFLLPAIGRTRDTDGARFTRDMLERLGKKGRPTLLFYPNGRKWEDMPDAVKRYIMEGEKAGLPKRILISTRNPWYKMETRKTPEFLFAYLGRRNTRFIRNEAGIVPLTGFLCVYPKSNDANFIEGLWAILQHPDTIANLMLVGKSYGSGAIKVEPRGLEKLPISKKLVQQHHLQNLLKNPQPTPSIAQYVGE